MGTKTYVVDRMGYKALAEPDVRVPRLSQSESRSLGWKILHGGNLTENQKNYMRSSTESIHKCVKEWMEISQLKKDVMNDLETLDEVIVAFHEISAGRLNSLRNTIYGNYWNDEERDYRLQLSFEPRDYSGRSETTISLDTYEALNYPDGKLYWGNTGLCMGLPKGEFNRIKRKHKRCKAKQNREAKGLAGLIRKGLKQGHRVSFDMECLESGRGLNKVWDIAYRLNLNTDVIVNLHFIRLS